jgi:hypothetical protein
MSRNTRGGWNKDLKFTEKVLQRSIDIIESKEHLNMHEATARKHAKRYLMHFNGNTCSICGVTEWMDKPVPLVCDHIDGNSRNNNIDNFRLVCCNCDAQLPTYKSKNKNGRKYDREYYEKSK